MNNIEKTIRINELFDIYKSLLTPKQQQVMENYYVFDLSIGEIADNNKTSRAAIFDLIKRTTNILEDYEAKLKLLEKRTKINKILEKEDEKLKEKIINLL